MRENQAILKYKTRGGSTAREKAKVYFSYHHDDFAYFDHICDLILDKQDCAIYYYDYSEEQPNFEELMLYLNEMQLFVVPVTSNYLEQSCNAYDKELRFARENHIPVLPLLQNSGVEFKKKFSEKCFKIQYLDENQDDGTKVSFEQKLENYLSSVLVNYEDAERIKKAFVKHIFLSYRKKDRGYANRLMKLIHSHEEFRDIAIWYDEFLDIGKDYNESIQNEMRNSDLFVLLVTPSLLETDNYIMRQEYPDACENNKIILPVESVRTDGFLLKKYYKQIPECVDMNDVEAIVSALHSSLKISASFDSESSERIYLIGMAYLKGIDVERNLDIAVQLITDSADLGNIEAVKTLRSMYKMGQGVEANEKKYIELHREVVRILEEEFQKSKDEKVLDDLLQETYDLGDILIRLGELSEAEHIYTQAILSGRMFMSRNDSKGKILIIKVLCALGDIEEQKGNFSDARDYYIDSLEKARRLYEELVTSTDLQGAEHISLNAEIKNWLASCYEHMGDIEKKLENHLDAKEYYKSALILTKEACEENKTISIMHDLFVSYDRLYEIDIILGVFDEASRFYRSTLYEREMLAKEARSEEIVGDVYVSYERLSIIRNAEGILKADQGDYQGALLCFEEAFSYVTKLEDSLQKRNIIGKLYFQMAICMFKNGDKKSCVITFLDKSIKWLISAKNICEADSLLVRINQMINDAYEMMENLRSQ